MSEPLSREFLLARGYCCHLKCKNCPYTTNHMIEDYLKELQETWGYTIEELLDIKNQMAAYALDACMDSEVRAEAEHIAELHMKFGNGLNAVADIIEKDLDNE